MTDSRAEMDRLLKQIEQEAYSRGYSDAIAAVTAAATAAAPRMGDSAQPRVSASNGNSDAKPDVDEAPRGRGRPATAVASVRDAIFEKPGMKGADLVRHLEQRGTPVLERTVRSCLRRLKNVEVRQREGRWYPKRKPETENGALFRPLAENGNGEVLITPPH